MSTNTKIEWTDTTWNPITGCTKVSPGCAHCYITRTPPFRIGHRQFDEKGTTGVHLHPERLEEPLRWRKPRCVFVNSLSDLFHESVPMEYIARIFSVMSSSTTECGKRHKHRPEYWTGPGHTFQILTKRPARMREVLEALPDYAAENFDGDSALNMAFEVARGWPLPNVWLGVSVENQHFADERIPLLLQTPAAVRFISAEPLLGPVDLTAVMQRLQPPVDDDQKLRINALRCVVPKHLDWVIVGGESGPGSRPMHPDWARSLRNQCQAAGVKFFFKQWGEFAPVTRTDGIHESPFGGQHLLRVGKKKAGRLLDGVEWNEFPQ